MFTLQILNQSFEKIPATVSAINRQSPSPTKSLQIIYLETLRELEKICDAIDNYAELEKLVLLRRSHWLHENTSCIVSIQLQPQKLPQSSKSGNLTSFAKRMMSNYIIKIYFKVSIIRRIIIACPWILECSVVAKLF